MSCRLLIAFLIAFSVLVNTKFSFSEVYSFNKESTVIGLKRSYTVKETESLIEIARKFNLGYNEIVAANPGVDPYLPGVGRNINIPTSWILPESNDYEGIIINLSEMRLFYFFRSNGKNFVRTFPIGIGREGYDTPLGTFKIIQKVEKPTWYVPESVRAEKPHLPKVVPPGPDNPLGSHALRLSLPSYLIHGTNKPWGVGRKVSHGCIRLYPEDIPTLYRLVKNGTKVRIIRQPVKIGTRDGKVFIEVHEDDMYDNNYFGEAFSLLSKKFLLDSIDKKKLYQALTRKTGEPVQISD
ncbi:MAG: L,D-transpeptidase family protein [Thermodesulfovibrionales bacterium]|nr:L,D-transpeptidase family protein [Thermodesulfovibrionales bacterium]